MDKLPKYVADLIEILDEHVPEPVVTDMTLTQWGNMDAGAVRRLAFIAGQRALVDALIAAQREVENEKGDADSEDDGPEPSLFGRVLDPNGNERRDVASLHLAAAFTDDGGGDAGGDEG